MKRKRWIAALAVWAVFCAGWRLWGGGEAALPAVFAFPFAQVGALLRRMSLSGAAGNIAAIILYAGFCLLPAAVLLGVRVFSRKARRWRPEDALVFLMSILLFGAEYLMINPGRIPEALGAAAVLGKELLGGLIHTVWIAYAVLCLLRTACAAGEQRRIGILRVMLYLFSAVCVFAVFWVSFGGLADRLRAVSQTGGTGAVTAAVFAVLRCLAESLPWLFGLAVISAGLELTVTLRDDRYGETMTRAAAKLSRRCALSLAATVLSNLGFYLLQMLFIRSLTEVSGSVPLPLGPMAFLTAVLLLSGFLAENRRLKEDNDLFV